MCLNVNASVLVWSHFADLFCFYWNSVIVVRWPVVCLCWVCVKGYKICIPKLPGPLVILSFTEERFTVRLKIYLDFTAIGFFECLKIKRYSIDWDFHSQTLTVTKNVCFTWNICFMYDNKLIKMPLTVRL